MKLTEAQLAGLEKQLDQALACTELEALEAIHIDWTGIKDHLLPPVLRLKTKEYFGHCIRLAMGLGPQPD